VREQEQQRVAVGTRKRACHFWSLGGVRRGPQRAASATAGGTEYRGCCRLRRFAAGRRNGRAACGGGRPLLLLLLCMQGGSL